MRIVLLFFVFTLACSGSDQFKAPNSNDGNYTSIGIIPYDPCKEHPCDEKDYIDGNQLPPWPQGTSGQPAEGFKIK